MAADKDQAKEPEAATTDAAPPRASRKGIVLGVVVAGALLGVAASVFLVAPRLDATAADTAAKAAAQEEAESAALWQASKIFALENLIVNPAGSEGSRFLMTTVAFELADPADELKLREREVQVRDRVVAVLENQSMVALTQPGARDSLKEQLAAAILPVLGPKAPVRVYLPQFVIQ